MENILSLSEILFPNQYRRKVLALMLMNPQKWLHLRELARLTGASPGTLKKELDGLVAVGLLRLQKVGNQTQFCGNTEHPVYPELSGLIRKTTGLKDVLVAALQALTPHIAQAFVFGSMAKGTEGPQSDVDLMIIGDLSFGQVVNAVYDAQTSLAREINPKVMTRQEWSDKKEVHNTFVQELMNKPKLFIIGAEHEL
ncbi:MAG: DNA polymerase subunit beta [Comamonadaceae bacterium PBBC2]|nr:MAG: DNA polymerase subunit beta [Comamonadaceae bacterium PBBC2]